MTESLIKPDFIDSFNKVESHLCIKMWDMHLTECDHVTLLNASCWSIAPPALFIRLLRLFHTFDQF